MNDRETCKAFCWQARGCDEEMQSRCPHNVPGEPCPAECHFAACGRPTHKVSRDFEVLLNPELDYGAAVKQVCCFCEFFLTRGPRLEDGLNSPARVGNPNRFLL